MLMMNHTGWHVAQANKMPWMDLGLGPVPVNPYRTPVVKSYQQALRKRVAQAGLYRKHALDAPLLAGFKQYLIQDLGVVNCSQEIDNVSRFLFFMDLSEASLKLMKDISKTRNFFYQLRMTGLSRQTIANYIKNINRFLCYILNATNLRQ
uniref:Core-binding (CB) domain-containing protein n=1 Tax=Lepisosteus oculatus TaxID=7918 RepID=W5LX82_LEPOC